MDIVRHVINGVETAEAARTGQVFDPATGQVSKQVAFASTAEVDSAIAAAAAIAESTSAVDAKATCFDT